MAWDEAILRDKKCVGCGKTLRAPYFAIDPECRECAEEKAGRQLFPRKPGEPPYQGPNAWKDDGETIH